MSVTILRCPCGHDGDQHKMAVEKTASKGRLCVVCGSACDGWPFDMRRGDWTVHKGRSNSDPEFLRLCDEVDRLLRDGPGWMLDRAYTRGLAGLIMAQLAHVHGLAPGKFPPDEIPAA